VTQTKNLLDEVKILIDSKVMTRFHSQRFKKLQILATSLKSKNKKNAIDS